MRAFSVLLALCLLSLPARAAEPTVVPVRTTVTLSDGQQLVGRVLRLEGGDVQLVLADGTELLLPAAAVASIAPVRDAPGAEEARWGVDPNRSRYLYSPTAFGLGQGNGYVAQRALALTSAAVGVTDWFDLEAGTILPLLFTKSPVGIVGGKLAFRATDHLRLGAGTQFLMVPIDGVQAVGLAFGNVTVGSADRHLTVAAGGVFSLTEGAADAVVTTVGGNYRLGPKTALISENWFFVFTEGDGPWGGPVFLVPSGGVRLFGPSFAVDLAVVPVVTGQSDLPIIPLPWVSFAWNFALKKGGG
ncbi:MAG: hypothetical protein H6742_14580 [Alphaproteobacteria bacterium]|nr:hypothetical protein [Alphaproteobacteria bacterium]